MNAVADSRETAFEELVTEVLEPVRRFLARRTDPATADDVLAEVLLVVWRRSDEIPDEPLPWTYGVARNCLANAERSARRQRRLAAKIVAVDPPTEVEVSDPAAVERVQVAMASLPDADAELLRLWAWEHLGSAEIADVLAISPNAASIRLHRAREKFRAILRKQQPDAGHEVLNEGSGDD